MARGNQGQPIFRDDEDRRRFLATLVETPEGNLVAGKKRESHSGGARRAHGEVAARKLLMAGLRVLGMEVGEIGSIETPAFANGGANE